MDNDTNKEMVDFVKGGLKELLLRYETCGSSEFIARMDRAHDEKEKYVTQWLRSMLERLYYPNRIAEDDELFSEYKSMSLVELTDLKVYYKTLYLYLFYIRVDMFETYVYLVRAYPIALDFEAVMYGLEMESQLKYRDIRE